MKKTIASFLAAVALTATTAFISCNNGAAHSGDTDNDSTTVADQPLDYDHTPLSADSVFISVWMGNQSFDIDGRTGQYTVSDWENGTDTITKLKLVSYKVLEEKETKTEWECHGFLVANAYDGETGAYLGQYRGEYDSFCFSDDEEGNGDDGYDHCGAGFSGMYYEANGDSTEFSFYAD